MATAISPYAEYPSASAVEKGTPDYKLYSTLDDVKLFETRVANSQQQQQQQQQEQEKQPEPDEEQTLPKIPESASPDVPQESMVSLKTNYRQAASKVPILKQRNLLEEDRQPEAPKPMEQNPGESKSTQQHASCVNRPVTSKPRSPSATRKRGFHAGRPATAPGRVSTDKLASSARVAEYDEALRLHGWRMEIHGDPLGLKGPHIPARQLINTSLRLPDVRPPLPRLAKSNPSAFFQASLPRVTLSFDIHPDFASEKYARARARLMRLGRWNFACRDFAFIY